MSGYVGTFFVFTVALLHIWQLWYTHYNSNGRRFSRRMMANLHRKIDTTHSQIAKRTKWKLKKPSKKLYQIVLHFRFPTNSSTTYSSQLTLHYKKYSRWRLHIFTNKQPNANRKHFRLVCSPDSSVLYLKIDLFGKLFHTLKTTSRSVVLFDLWSAFMQLQWIGIRPLLFNLDLFNSVKWQVFL